MSSSFINVLVPQWPLENGALGFNFFALGSETWLNMGWNQINKE